MRELKLAAALLLALLSTGCGTEPAGTKPGAAPEPAAQQRVADAPKASSAPSAAPLTAAFDAAWSPYFPAGPLVYGAVRNLAFYNPTLGKPEDAGRVREARAKLPTPRGASGNFADWLQEINEFLLDRKLVTVSFVELFETGFAFALEYDSKEPEPHLTLLASRNPKLTAFLAAWEKEGAKGAEVVRTKLAAGELSVYRRRDRRQPLCLIPLGEKLLVCSDPARLEAAIARAAEGGPGIASTAGHKEAASQLSPDAAVFLVFDTARIADNLRAQQAARAQSVAQSPAATLQSMGLPGMAQSMLGQAQPGSRALEAVSSLSSLWLQFVYQPNLATLDLRLGLPAGASAESTGPLALLAASLPEKPLKSPALASVNSPIYIAMAVPGNPGTERSASDPSSQQQLARQLAMTAAMAVGLNYDKEVSPWLGQELALSVLWDAKLPQVALLLAAEDEEACRKSMLRAASNFKGKLAFTEKTVGSQKIWVAPLPDRPQIQLCWAVSGGFLILASGQSVVESLLDAPQKLRDHPGFASLFSVLGGDRVQLAGFLSIDMFERLAELTGTDRSALEIQIRAACLDNLAQLAAGKLKPPDAICPAAGKYEKGTGAFECTVHGQAGNPKPLAPPSPSAEVLAARQLAALVSSVAFGATPAGPSSYRVTFVLRRR